MNNCIAVVAAHPDDEVLGCGGTISRAANEGAEVHILLIADGESARASNCEGGDEMKDKIRGRNAATEAAGKILGTTSTEILTLPDNRLDGIELLEIVKRIEVFLQRVRPSTVMTHHAGDVNIDHRIVHDAVVAAVRPYPSQSVRELLCFEVPSSTEWRPPGSGAAFCPNWFVDISSTLHVKLGALDAYRDEMRAFPHPRSIEGVSALARWRGATVGVPAAEAFVLARRLL